MKTKHLTAVHFEGEQAPTGSWNPFWHPHGPFVKGRRPKTRLMVRGCYWFCCQFHLLFILNVALLQKVSRSFGWGEKYVRKKKEKPPACCFVVPCWVPKYLIFLFPLFCLLPPAPPLSCFVLLSPRLCRQRSWGRLNLSRKGFCLSTSPLCSVLFHLSSVFPPALSCSGGTLWPSSSAVSRSALQAGFHSLRSYCLSLFLFLSLTLYIHSSHLLPMSLLFFSFTSFFLQLFLSAIHSDLLPPTPAKSSHLSYVLCKTSNTLWRNLFLLFAASLGHCFFLFFFCWSRLGSDNEQRRETQGEREKCWK